mgnify:CR=1 FL=1
MKHHNIFKTLSVLFAALLLCPLCGQAQTMRGDINMDGTVGLDDLTAMINALVFDTYGEPRPEDRDTVTVNGVPFVMVRVHGGTYSRDALDNCIHEVETFSIGLTEVTKSQWVAVMDSLPNGGTVYNQYPVVGVTWNQCQAFITRLNALTGLNFRLPSLIEWEYAATGGKLTRAYRYAGSDNLDEVGWYEENSGSSAVHLVGQLKPNELGLYDMSGNVSEWCHDEIGAMNEPRHGVRGGTSLNNEKACRTMTWPESFDSAVAAGDVVLPLCGLRLAL